MTYPADTPDWDNLVLRMEDHGFKREVEDDDGEEQWWERPATRDDPHLMVDDNASEPGNLALWREPSPIEPQGQWVLLYEGPPIGVANRIDEELNRRDEPE